MRDKIWLEKGTHNVRIDYQTNAGVVKKRADWYWPTVYFRAEYYDN